MSKLTREQVLKLANLSRLDLSEEEILRYQKELSDILAYVERLESVDVAGLEPSYQVSGLQNVMRKDVVKHQPSSAEELLNVVPKQKDRYIQVGRMI